MAVNKNGTNLAKEHIERAVWFDIEKREKDDQPAVTGILIEGIFRIVVHDEQLAIAAEYSGLEVENGASFYQNLIRKCREENRLLISYTKADHKYIADAYPHLEMELNEVYQKTKFTSWFRQHRPVLFAEMQRKQGSRARNRRARNPPQKKQSGEYRIGLKEMLKLNDIDYPERGKVGIGGSADAIRKIRERHAKTGTDIERLTKGEKRAWSRMLTYLQHDVLGLEHLTRWVNSD